MSQVSLNKENLNLVILALIIAPRLLSISLVKMSATILHTTSSLANSELEKDKVYGLN